MRRGVVAFSPGKRKKNRGRLAGIIAVGLLSLVFVFFLSFLIAFNMLTEPHKLEVSTSDPRATGEGTTPEQEISRLQDENALLQYRIEELEAQLDKYSGQTGAAVRPPSIPNSSSSDRTTARPSPTPTATSGTRASASPSPTGRAVPTASPSVSATPRPTASEAAATSTPLSRPISTLPPKNTEE